MKKIKLNYNNFINDYLHDVDKAIEETVKVQKKKIVSLVEKIKKVNDNWVKKAIEFYIDKDDLVILISTSGNSQNVINAAKFLKQKKFSFFSLSGMKKNNLLNKISKPNNCIWVNNMSYNQIEIIHHLILLLTIDILIGKSVYKS